MGWAFLAGLVPAIISGVKSLVHQVSGTVKLGTTTVTRTEPAPAPAATTTTTTAALSNNYKMYLFAALALFGAFFLFRSKK